MRGLPAPPPLPRFRRGGLRNLCRSPGHPLLRDLWGRGLPLRARALRPLRGQAKGPELLGDEEARRRNGLEPLYSALVEASQPRAVLDWLVKRGSSIQALSRIAEGELPLSYALLDALEIEFGPRAIGHLEQLLGATGALPARDQVLVKFERWCERFLSGIERPEHAALLRTFLRWQILRPLRQKADLRPLTESQGVAPRGQLTVIAQFCAWLDRRERSLADCRQEDIDLWFATQPPHRLQPIRRLTTWASARGAMPRLDVPTRAPTPPKLPPEADQRWALARRLIQEPRIRASERVAGALVVIYAPAALPNHSTAARRRGHSPGSRDRSLRDDRHRHARAARGSRPGAVVATSLAKETQDRRSVSVALSWGGPWAFDHGRARSPTGCSASVSAP